jgi:hypothetical protein
MQGYICQYSQGIYTSFKWVSRIFKWKLNLTKLTKCFLAEFLSYLRTIFDIILNIRIYISITRLNKNVHTNLCC